MKVPTSLRLRHDEHDQLAKLLEKQVRDTLKPRLPETWHYEGRRKKIESYVLKIETGRFDHDDLEDFFGCTVVVPTMNHLANAEEIVEELFDVVSRKPETAKHAVAGPLDFRFDHIRLYTRLKVAPGIDAGPVHRLRFEIQVKTYLQHAWSIATHDLTYKTSNLSWGKERVAAQVKATLEAAEISIVEAEKLAGLGNQMLSRADDESLELARIADTLLRSFVPGDLPEDLKRLSGTVRATFSACTIPSDQLETILKRGKARRGGSHPNNYSPYGVILSYLIDQKTSKLKAALRRKNGVKIFIPPEIELPSDFSVADLPSLRTVERAT